MVTVPKPKNLIWTPLKFIYPYGPKMEIFNFELEEKLDLDFDVQFDCKSDGNSPEI